MVILSYLPSNSTLKISGLKKQDPFARNGSCDFNRQQSVFASSHTFSSKNQIDNTPELIQSDANFYCFIYSHCYVTTVVWKKKDPDNFSLIVHSLLISVNIDKWTHIHILSVDCVYYCIF